MSRAAESIIRAVNKPADRHWSSLPKDVCEGLVAEGRKVIERLDCDGHIVLSKHAMTQYERVRRMAELLMSAQTAEVQCVMKLHRAYKDDVTGEPLAEFGKRLDAASLEVARAKGELAAALGNLLTIDRTAGAK